MLLFLVFPDQCTGNSEHGEVIGELHMTILVWSKTGAATKVNLLYIFM